MKAASATVAAISHGLTLGFHCLSAGTVTVLSSEFGDDEGLNLSALGLAIAGYKSETLRLRASAQPLMHFHENPALLVRAKSLYQ
jgi:hypothetical protein